MHSGDTPGITQLLKDCENKEKNVATKCSSYIDCFEGPAKENTLHEERKGKNVEYVSTFYDLVTDFYEYGWGESFHFTPLQKGESREHAIAKHEYRLALKLGLKAGDKVLDMGCGIGGPARHIATFTGGNIIGININEYQLKRANILTENAGLQKVCSFQKDDFNKLSFSSNSFDAIYSIEAICHACDPLPPYKEAMRVLKPGGMIAVYDWIMTDKYDEADASHRHIKKEIMVGNSLHDIRTTSQITEAIKMAGLEIVEVEDLALSSPVPWQSLLQAKFTLADIRLTPFGRWMTHAFLAGLERVGLAPKGSCHVHKTLCRGADSLVEGGNTGIFSPLLLILAKKPS